jgi:hypothetical protein
MLQVFHPFFSKVQVFHLAVAKVDMNVAYVPMTIHMYVANVCSKCFICFRRMLQVFHLDVAKLDMDVALITIAIQTFGR